ncbi:MAG: carbohydrate porin, partial [Acidobacteriota bacterium]
MRHFHAFLTVVVLNVLFAGVSFGQAPAPKATTSATDLEARVAALEKRLAIVEAQLATVARSMPLASSAPSSREGDNFIGKWQPYDVEISRQGDYFLWKDTGRLHSEQFRFKDGELVGSMGITVTFNRENGHI